MPVVLGSANDYVAASLLFGILVVVGPLLAAAARGANGYMPGWAFLVATGVTSWAVLGQLGTMALVFYEAERSNNLTYGAVVPTWFALALSIGAVIWYALSTVDSALKSAKQAPSGNATPEGLDADDCVTEVIEALAAAGQAADMMTAALTEARAGSQVLAPAQRRTR